MKKVRFWAPLASCIAMLDTTTIFKVSPIPEAAILEQKGLLYYDYACCYALVGQKTKMRTYRQQALAALEQSVLLGYKDYNNMVNDNWKCDTTTDPEVFWAKPKKEQ